MNSSFTLWNREIEMCPVCRLWIWSWRNLKSTSKSKASQYLDLQRIKVRDTNSLQKVVPHMWFIFNCYYIMSLRKDGWRALQLFFLLQKTEIDPEHWRPLWQNFLPLLFYFALFHFFLPSKSPASSPVLPFWWLFTEGYNLIHPAFFLPGKLLCNSTVEVVEASSLENHVCAHLGSTLISFWFSHTCPVKSVL